VMVQGDTTTAMAAGLAAFYKHIPVLHIEAGLRSQDNDSPWPEEANRKIIGDLAALHFAPTPEAQTNLLNEHKPADTIFVTGNTVIDTLLHFSKRLDQDRDLIDALDRQWAFLDRAKKLILVTSHRRENFDGGIAQICAAIAELAARGDTEIVFPVHPNPQVHGVVYEALAGVPNVHLTEPQDYLPFVYLLKRATLVASDSGGVQEEAPSLGKPVLVLRTTTERPEGVAAGTAKLVGTDPAQIVGEASRLLDDPEAYRQMSEAHNPYGDGHASQRIVEEFLRHV
jgi:UDP-N-acetylglucosamine 2-epimerase